MIFSPRQSLRCTSTLIVWIIINVALHENLIQYKSKSWHNTFPTQVEVIEKYRSNTGRDLRNNTETTNVEIMEQNRSKTSQGHGKIQIQQRSRLLNPRQIRVFKRYRYNTGQGHCTQIQHRPSSLITYAQHR